LPIADKIESGTYLVYDGAMGSGGMLTVAEQRLQELANKSDKEVSIHLYGQELQPETFAIAKADLLLKGDGSEAENIKYGSTLSNDQFGSYQFDFMLSNPPYGKSWKADLERMGGKKEMKDPRFIIEHNGDPEYSMLTRSSDGQLMFLVNKLMKMKQDTKLGSRIAEVHNGSALFTGGAGQGESNVRRWILENDWLEAIVALPENIFYNTGIATYIWILTNKKTEDRKGKVQLIDATKWYESLRKNLGSKNCRLSEEHIKKICDLVLNPRETEESKIFLNEDFGYQKVIVERPVKIKDAELRVYKPAEVNALKESKDTCEDGIPLIKKIYKKGTEADPLHGLFELDIDGEKRVVEYHPDTDLRDSEQIPLLEDGGITAFIEREVLPYTPDAWIDESKTQIGYEISFTKYFYKPISMRTLAEIKADIFALEQETEGLLEEIVGEAE
jgi:type I restriction enzyme M protein